MIEGVTLLSGGDLVDLESASEGWGWGWGRGVVRRGVRGVWLKNVCVRGMSERGVTEKYCICTIRIYKWCGRIVKNGVVKRGVA